MPGDSIVLGVGNDAGDFRFGECPLVFLGAVLVESVRLHARLREHCVIAQDGGKQSRNSRSCP